MKSIEPRLRLSATWSVAGVGTCMVVDLNESGNQCICFDIGSTPIFDKAVSASFVFISHGHLDHIGGIFSHARAHRLLYSSTPTYYVPEDLVSKLEKARKAMSELDSFSFGTSTGSRTDSLMAMKIIGVKSGEEYLFSPRKNGQFFARTFAVDHGGHPCMGYVIGRKVPGGLLPEFKDLPPRQIGELVKSGMQVKAQPKEVLEISYSGDTCLYGLISQQKSITKNNIENGNEEKAFKHLSQAFRAPLVLCELTFLQSMDEKSKSLAKKTGHLHIDDLPEILSSHGWNLKTNNFSQTIVLYHLSHRYRPAYRALDLIVEGLPETLIKCVNVAISSFLEKEDEQILTEFIKENGCISLFEYAEGRRKPLNREKN